VSKVSAQLLHQKKETFLSAFAQNGNISASCRAADIERTQHYRWLKEDAEYVARFTVAGENAIDVLEKEARRRGVEGVTKPIYQGGKLVGEVQEYSDTLLIFLLKGARPERYRERYDITMNVGDAARKAAQEAGLDPDVVLAEAERIVKAGT
jgi:hypothetical protein